MDTELQVSKSPQGWIVAMTPEMAEVAGVDASSAILLHVDKEQITAEIISPLGPALDRMVDETIETMRDAFGEMKKHGD